MGIFRSAIYFLSRQFLEVTKQRKSGNMPYSHLIKQRVLSLGHNGTVPFFFFLILLYYALKFEETNKENLLKWLYSTMIFFLYTASITG